MAISNGETRVLALHVIVTSFVLRRAQRVGGCPVEMALRDATGQYWSVCDLWARSDGGEWVRLPAVAAEGAALVAAKKSCAPFSFAIEAAIFAEPLPASTRGRPKRRAQPIEQNTLDEMARQTESFRQWWQEQQQGGKRPTCGYF